MDKKFIYKGEELNDVNITIQKGIYKIENENDIPFISFLVRGNDKDNNVISYNFSLNNDSEILNSLDDGQYDINSLILNGDAFSSINNQKEEMDLCLPQESNEDMFNDVSSFWIQKQNNNTFLLKISIPSKCIFSYFYFNN